MLYNSNTWVNMKTSDYEDLQKVQNFFVHSLMRCPRNTPGFANYKEFGLIPIENQIERNKMVLHGHIVMQDDKSLVKRVVIEERNWEHTKSWNCEIEDLFEKYGVGDREKSVWNAREAIIERKRKWKTIIQKKVSEKVEKDTDRKIRKKGRRLRGSENGFKGYLKELSYENARAIFLARYDMTTGSKNHTIGSQLIPENGKCLLCKKFKDRTRHVFRCEQNRIKESIYRNLYSNNMKKLKKAAEVVKEWERMMEERKKENKREVEYNDEKCKATRCKEPKGRRVMWIQCDKCSNWYHCKCINCDYKIYKGRKNFVCGCE